MQNVQLMYLIPSNKRTKHSEIQLAQSWWFQISFHVTPELYCFVWRIALSRGRRDKHDNGGLRQLIAFNIGNKIDENILLFAFLQIPHEQTSCAALLQIQLALRCLSLFLFAMRRELQPLGWTCFNAKWHTKHVNKKKRLRFRGFCLLS